jgi:MFS family permease
MLNAYCLLLMNAIEKRPLTFTLFLLRLLSGIVGGIAGTLALLIVYFALLAIVPQGDSSTISVFVMILMAFVGTIVANTIVAIMVTFLDNDKYFRRKTTITQVFLFNLVLFFLTIPLYFLGISLDVANGIAALHFLLSAFISALIMEVLAGYAYSLVGIYSTALGIFVAIGVAMGLLTLDISTTALTFTAMPAVWFILQVVGGLTELIYDNFLRLYGVDALNANTDIGGDNEIEKKDEDEDEEDDNDEESNES